MKNYFLFFVVAILGLVIYSCNSSETEDLKRDVEYWKQRHSEAKSHSYTLGDNLDKCGEEKEALKRNLADTVGLYKNLETQVYQKRFGWAADYLIGKRILKSSQDFDYRAADHEFGIDELPDEDVAWVYSEIFYLKHAICNILNFGSYKEWEKRDLQFELFLRDLSKLQILEDEQENLIQGIRNTWSLEELKNFAKMIKPYLYEDVEKIGEREFDFAQKRWEENREEKDWDTLHDALKSETANDKEYSEFRIVMKMHFWKKRQEERGLVPLLKIGVELIERA
jgi:hypothetical protein